MAQQFFEELSRCLRKEQIESYNKEDRRLEIFLHGQPVLSVSPGNEVFLLPAGSKNPEANELYHRVAIAADSAFEYVEAMENTPLLRARGLENKFHLLADFGGAVLAGRERAAGQGYEFVTWIWDYTQSAPLRSTNKDWDEDLKEQHGLEPQPPEEHPQLIVAGTICERIGAKCKAVRPEQASYQIPRLLQQYQNDLHWGRFEQAMDHMETMSALALSVVLRECRQMGTVLTEEQGARFLQSHIHPHQNRGSLKTRATEIGMEFQSVLAKDAVEGIRTEVEKKATASAWLELAISCAKVPIKYCADELRRQQKEEKALLEAAQAMASY